MGKKLLYILLLAAQFTVHSQNPELRTILDSCLVNMEKYSLNKSRVNWSLLNKQVAEKSQSLQHPEDLKEIAAFLFEQLGDFHGHLIYKGKSFKWTPNPMNVSKEIQEEWNNDSGIKTSMFGDIGYLQVPFMLKKDRDRQVKNLADSVCKLLVRKPKGIILDLRINDGGDMHPMILGLQQLLGEKTIMTYHYKDHPPNRIILKDHAILHETDKTLSHVPSCQFLAENLPVAILQGAQTASSGENVIISFKGRPNTLTIGEDSAGYTTINSRFEFLPDVYLLLAVGYATDRNGEKRVGKLKPDIYIQAVDNFKDLKADEKVNEAIKWLNKF